MIASIITIGDELLIGQTVDTNSAWMAQQLNAIGIKINRRVAVGDDAQAIREALDQEKKHADIILITGGLGPTSDDITKPVLLQYFGGEMTMNEEVLSKIETFFESRGLPMLERNKMQASVPEKCTVLKNEKGTAPGMLFIEKHPRNPSLQQWFISLPGVPHEMMGIMENEVLSRLQLQFVSDALLHRTIITAGLGESFIAEKIKDLEEALPAHIRLAYLPDFRLVKLRLSGTGKDKKALAYELQRRTEEIANRLADIVISLEDIPLEQLIGKCLTIQEKKLALAESCTGGNIAHKLTQVMGAAQYFMGSMVCYQNEVKQNLLAIDAHLLQEKGAVCKEVSEQMATGALQKLQADFGFGITGLLSAGLQDKVKPGTVFMSVADKNRTVTQEHHFSYDRLRNKEVAVQMGMLLIWKFINGKI